MRPHALVDSRSMSGRLRVVVLGYIVRGPLGGLAWHHLQYVPGLAQLGHEVAFLEDIDDYPSCYDPCRHVTDTDPTYGLAFAARAFRDVGLPHRWAYYDAHCHRRHGPFADRAVEYCKSADVLLNLSGVNPLRDVLQDVPVRIFVDTDPVFTQVRHLQDPSFRQRSELHNRFFTFAEIIGRPGCKVPDDGLPWQLTRQPVCLDSWPVTPGPPHGPFTTVMQWSSYASREYGGRHHGMKFASFQPYLRLPLESGETFELALGSPSAPRDELRTNGWRIRDPLTLSRDLSSYQQYIQGSKAEFSVAKQAYVTTRCGWFSERSAAYLASGRPVLVQDTGFREWLPATRGVVPFQSVEGAREGLDRITRDYSLHCRAARGVVEEVFTSRHVLSDLLARALTESVPAGTVRSESLSAKWWRSIRWDVTDGLTNTIFFGEVRPECSQHAQNGWAASNNGNGYCTTLIPINFDTCSDSAGDPCHRLCNWNTEVGFKSAHEGGAFFLLGDGSVHFISEHIDHQACQYVGAKDDGEVAPEF